jgi:tRNA-specific 2-thiouridylase
MKEKVIVGMSGGVDSSVAAWLLKEQGYEVEGLFMNNWEEDNVKGFCSAAQDLADAQAVCTQLTIPLHCVNFSQEYWERVFKRFLSEYEQGRTPNPDVLCNKEIKFDAFLNHALTLKADYIATGHYARNKIQGKIGHLLKAKDREKDQTYFLHAIAPEALAKTLFPIGDYTKPEVREFAKKLGLVTQAKKDSTGICFIGERRFKTFLNEFVLAQPGDIKNMENKVLGTHDGLMFYTLGQRQGLRIGGSGEPWYVVDKDVATNTLYVAQGSQHPMLYSQGLICAPIHWLSPEYSNQLPLTCYAKTRYRQTEQGCMISPQDGTQHYVMFSTLQRAVTPGQYVVFYDKNQCIGGATIEQVIR